MICNCPKPQNYQVAQMLVMRLFYELDDLNK